MLEVARVVPGTIFRRFWKLRLVPSGTFSVSTVSSLRPVSASLGLKDGSFRLHGDGFRNVSRLEDKIYAPSRVHDHIDAGYWTLV